VCFATISLGFGVVCVGAWGTKKKTRQKRPKYVKRDWYVRNETRVHGERCGVATVSRIDKLQVYFAEYSLFYRALLQKRRIILSILFTEATPYVWKSCKLVPEVQNKTHVQKGLIMWKETNKFEMRPTYMERDLCVYRSFEFVPEVQNKTHVKKDLWGLFWRCMHKSLFKFEKRRMYIRWDLYMCETYICGERPFVR